MSNIYDYRDAEMIIFGLNGVVDGNCECGNPECEALYKHPRASNWQSTPFYSDEQFECMRDIGHLGTGFGVLVKDLLIVDVDARNGGLESFSKLCKDLNLDIESLSGFVVETGSGGGSMHIYFKAPIPPVALMQSHPSYVGIDFKSSGFVVGSGSMHKSGMRYETRDGCPQDITEPPQALIDLLQKKTQYRSKDLDGAQIDVETEELQNIINHIEGWDDRNKWIEVGMAIHDTTSGSMEGLHLWTQWSSKSDKFKEGESADKWAGFGKNASVLSLGTLLFHAREDGGYIDPVVFNADEYIKHEPVETTLVDKIAHIDIRKPHGFAGVLCDWVNNQCLNPRENLAAAATLYILSSVGGMRHYDELNNMSLNIMPFCVAGSSSGKEPIFEAIMECFSTVGIMGAVHGSFKSEQEAVRNLLRHQASLYTIDEFGIELQKITNASGKGGASYLAGLIGFFMKTYSKATGVLPVSGDLKEDIKDKIKIEIARANKKADLEGEDKVKDELDQLYSQLSQADHGIINPFFNLFGLTTPVTFDKLVDQEMATNGFIARAVVFREHETNPRRKKKFKKQEMPVGINLSLNKLYHGGDSPTGHRVERVGEKQPIRTAHDAEDLLDEVYEHFYEMAEQHKTKTGLEAICRRGWEICSKVSLLTAMPSGTRTTSDVLYGFAVAKWDIEKKLELAYGNEAANHKETRGDALVVKIKSMLDKDSLTPVGQLRNRLRDFNHEQIDQALEILIKQSIAEKVESIHPVNKKSTFKYKLL